MFAAMRWVLCTLLIGCAPSAPTPPELVELELPGGHRFELDPPVVARGTTQPVRLRSRRSALDFEDTQLEIHAQGLTLREFAVLDGFTAFAELDVAEDAPVGRYAATLDSRTQRWELDEFVTVIDDRFTAEPDNAKMGEVVKVTLLGVNTAWENGLTWASFGPDVQTIDVTVVAPTELQARIAIASDALPGFRDITVEEGGSVLTLYDGFTVDRQVLTASWDPPVVTQGEEVEFRIEGVNTRFTQGITGADVQFWRQTAAVADLTFLDFFYESPTVLTGRAKVSNAATPGSRDVFIDQEEDLLIADALQILPSPPDPIDARMRIDLDLTRTISRNTGESSDSVRAYAIFFVPLDPPCSVGFNPSSGPVPFDINGVFPVPPPFDDPVDCPEVLTVDAGEQMWFEGPTNTITLLREQNPNTDQIYYRGQDLTLADYHFGDTYDVRVPGAEGGVPAFFVDNAQPTVPEEYRFVFPDFQGLTIDRFEDFDFDWTEAGVYPTGLFSISLNGTLLDTGEPGFVGVLPFDDGHHGFGPSQLSQLAPGNASFSAFSRVEGRVFQTPYNGRNVQADSRFTTIADVVLE